MMLGLVWIVGCYAAGIAILHILHWHRKQRGAERTVHYVLHTQNNQHQVEWYIRSLHFFSWVKGRTIRITLMDEGSTDETLAIAERLSLEYHLEIVTEPEQQAGQWMAEHEQERVIVVRLSQNDDLETAFKFM
ncbi:hypothetical protein [Paenibacillus cremeus]|uniref:Glycosyltransferase n=1 Tax=Paenibacillus cremeus TaxID=2163881 RepID=A0A559KB16_9BACL|nr:hypothetical protein [Paenibacillus cremeus]TVY09328.1 hypothetical protein FPZ49_14170 [Paenibacillus cremeus]